MNMFRGGVSVPSDLDNLLPWTGSGPCTVKVKRERRRPLNQGRRVRDLVSADDNHREKKDLTSRQKEIIRMLVDGEMRPTKIAYLLGLTDNAVHQEIRATCDKLLLFDRQALQAWARMYPEYWRQ